MLVAGEDKTRGDEDSTDCRLAAEIVDESVDNMTHAPMDTGGNIGTDDTSSGGLSHRSIGRLGCVNQVSGDANTSCEQASNESGDEHYGPVNVSHAIRDEGRPNASDLGDG